MTPEEMVEEKTKEAKLDDNVVSESMILEGLETTPIEIDAETSVVKDDSVPAFYPF